MNHRSPRQMAGAMVRVLKLRAQALRVPPVAPSLGRRGVFIGTSNSAGQGWAWARSLERADPSIKAVSARFDREATGFAFPVDQRIHPDLAAHSPIWQRRQFAALSGYLAAIVESGDSIFARKFMSDPLKQIRALQKRGVRMALLFHGSDIRDPDTHISAEPHSHFAADPEFARTFREVTARNRELIAASSLPVFVSTPDLLDEVANATWLPVVVDIDRWQSEIAPFHSRGAVRIAHIPSNSMVKGTELVEPLLSEYDRAGAIKFNALQRIPHAEMPAAISSVDIVIDQFRVGNYGVAACEALAAGRVVVSHVSDRVRTVTRELTREELPIVEATPETLADVLAEIMASPDEYAEFAARGPGFVRRHHNGDRSGGVLAKWLGTSTTED